MAPLIVNGPAAVASYTFTSSTSFNQGQIVAPRPLMRARRPAFSRCCSAGSIRRRTLQSQSTFVVADVTGDRVADLPIRIAEAVNLNAGDSIL